MWLGIKSDAKLLIQTLIKLSLWMLSESNYSWDTLINISSLTQRSVWAFLAHTAHRSRSFENTAGLRKGSFSGNEMNIFIISFGRVTADLSYFLGLKVPRQKPTNTWRPPFGNSNQSIMTTFSIPSIIWTGDHTSHKWYLFLRMSLKHLLAILAAQVQYERNCGSGLSSG